MIRPLQKPDFDDWKELFTGYADFYDTPITEERIQSVWSWTLDPAHILQCDVIEKDNRVVAFIHYHATPRTLSAQNICYLSDLFTHPDYRGQGLAKALIEHLQEKCQKEGWSTIRLITQHFNETARNLYDQFSGPSDFIVYHLPAKE